jgi:hypothetical protein
MSALVRLCGISALFCIAVMAGACQSESSSAPDTTVQTYGGSVDTAAAQAASEVAAEPSTLEGTTVTVDGHISTVCQKKGCWLALDAGPSGPIRVLVPRTDDGYEFTVPTTLAGRATVTGTLRIVELDAATQKHLEEDGAAPARTREVQIAATGIRVVPDA